MTLKKYRISNDQNEDDVIAAPAGFHADYADPEIELSEEDQTLMESHAELVAFIHLLDIRTRLTNGTHHLLLAMDRLACPIKTNTNIARFKQAINDIMKWSDTLPEAESKAVKDMLMQHVELSIKQMKNEG